ncbi:MAG: mycofactocin biosynthesis glycosyltransferase MftF [Actinomycetota bacterium]
MADRPPAPAGLNLVAAAGLRVEDDGCVLIGGSPPRLVRLSPAGAARVERWLAGVPVGPGTPERQLARRLLDAGLVHPRPSARADGSVTVVMPARDEPAIGPAVARIAGGSPAIVVDDASTEPVAPAAGVEILRRSTPGGPGVARNDGVRRAVDAGASFVAFIDADVDPPPGWIDRLAAHFADPAVAAVAPRVRPTEGSSSLDRYESTFPSLDLGTEPASVGPGRSVAYVPSAALVVRIAAFDEIGGFDPALRFGEDVDLIWRLVAAGHTVRYEPSVEVRHRARDDWRSWLRQRRDYGSSAAALAARHGDAVAPARAPVGVYATLAAGVVAPTPVAVAIGATELVAARRRVRASLGEHHDPVLVHRGLVSAVRTSAIALLRALLPAVAVALLAGRRSRRRMTTVMVAAVAAEVAESPRRLGWVRTTGLRIVDHAAYGSGVWAGLLRAGSSGLAAIRPVVSRPGVRTDPAATDTVAP